MEAIGRLAGGVAHDFNTLLNVMLGYSDLLLAELPGNDQRRERVKQIKNAAEAGSLLTKQLLAFSRKQATAEEVMDLCEVTARMTPILGRLLRDDVVLTVHSSPLPCPVKVDPGQFQQLILNLVSNAADAMPNGGHLEVDVQEFEVDQAYVQQHPSLTPGPYAMVAISDTGTGMNPQTAAHIFEPFFTTKDAGKGTGLGLSTVYAIVKRYGGDIWVYSEPGAGTVFKILLPFTTERVQPLVAAPARFQSGNGAGETILLVEDSGPLRELTKVILTHAGYNVLEAEDGVAALEVSRAYTGPIHLMLTDVVMPRMRGPVLAAQMVNLRPGIAVVFLSGYAEEVLAQTDSLGGHPLVEKPYTANVLLQCIRRVLDETAPRRSLTA
jgi:CheY-like chemotaxis protein